MNYAKEMIIICMITAVPANVEIPREGIENGTIFNDDGHGWALAHEDVGILVYKSMNGKDALDSFIEARKDIGMDSIGMFHSRLATHGTTNLFNVHPFPVTDEDTVMAHNGILPSKWHPKKDDPRSDTRIMADTTLPLYLTESGLPSRRGARRLGEMIGANKLVILSVKSGKPRMRIVNAYLGQHSQGCWFSNDGYCDNWRSWGMSSGNRYWGEGSKVILGGSESSLNAPDDDSYSITKCDICQEAGWINLDTETCEFCWTCQECWYHDDDCRCAKYAAEEAERRERRELEIYEALHAEREVTFEAPWDDVPMIGHRR